MKCSSCDSRINRYEACYGDAGTFYENKPLCETCYYESEPCATVFYIRDGEPHIISETRNETENQFRVKWISTDPWRGYFKTESEDYTIVNTAELLAYHESEEMLEKFDKRIRRLFDEHDIDYARVFARSSNVFYNNYDLYARKKHELPARILSAKAKQEADYGNPKWYRGILFDEEALSKLSELFPEEKIQTDNDAVKVVQRYGDNLIAELKKRMNEKNIR